MYQEQYADCLEYIDNYWNQIIFSPSTIHLKYRYINLPTFLPDKKSNPHIIFVPHNYFVPNLGAQKRICYWDTFFMFRGLMGTKRERLMKSMVDNLIYLFDKYQIIPNFNAPASINRSQPPFLSSMILDTYLSPLTKYNPNKSIGSISVYVYKLKNKKWLKDAIVKAKKEYELVWIDIENKYNHHVNGYYLSRYGDRDIGYAHSSELESGWDMTSRFYNRCDQFLPIDLNSYLYKYEKDFAYVAEIFGNTMDAEYWNNKATERKNEINKYMWNEQEGFFFDYGYVFKQVSHFFSLASYTPMWAGFASEYQAKRMVEKLSKFETPYGLSICAKESLARPIDISKIQRRYHPAIDEIVKPKQWDYPNIWSPLEYLTVIGLLKYGFVEDAKRIMINSIKAHSQLYRKYGSFFEKLNGESGESGSGALYGDQKGFGWTNSVFYRYISILDDLETRKSIYTEPKPTKPPYNFSILH